LRRSPEKLPSQPLIERLRVREKERLAHATNDLIETGAQRQPNRQLFRRR
jgi:hypothetical protein